MNEKSIESENVFQGKEIDKVWQIIREKLFDYFSC